MTCAIYHHEFLKYMVFKATGKQILNMKIETIQVAKISYKVFLKVKKTNKYVYNILLKKDEG